MVTLQKGLNFMDFISGSCRDFVEVLASKAPTPGGGGAAAYVGAIGTALGNMVGSLTVGKKKYADVEADILELNDKAKALQSELLALVAKDAEVFEPLSRAYGMPKDTPEQQAEKTRVMEAALLECCEVPMNIMRCCCEAIELHAEYAKKGTAIAISDVGVGVECCRAALRGASLNVFINTKYMADKSRADELNAKAKQMLQKYCKMAEEIYADVEARFF